MDARAGRIRVARTRVIASKEKLSMNQSLKGRKVAIVATHGFEQAELTEPQKALKQAGATVHVIAPQSGEIQGFRHFDKGERVMVDRTLAEAKPGDYDALVIPGGLFNPDRLRTDERALAFLRAMMQADKPVGAICHGPWLLINAGLADGRTLTSVPTIRKDLENAGAITVEKEVVVDGQLVTSRTPKDLPAFCAALIERIAHSESHSMATA
jgi:protease I